MATRLINPFSDSHLVPDGDVGAFSSVFALADHSILTARCV